MIAQWLLNKPLLCLKVTLKTMAMTMVLHQPLRLTEYTQWRRQSN